MTLIEIVLRLRMFNVLQDAQLVELSQGLKSKGAGDPTQSGMLTARSNIG